MKTVWYKSKDLQKKIEEELKGGFKRWKETKGRDPVLVAVISGEDKASELFVRKKREFGEKIGVEVRVLDVSDKSVGEFKSLLEKLSDDEGVDGIFCQLPMGKDFLENQKELLNTISEEKDVDCLGKWRIKEFEEGETEVVAGVVKAVGWVFADLDLTDFKNLSVGVVGDRGYVGKTMVGGLLNWGVKKVLGVDIDDFEEKTGKLKDVEVVISCVGSPGLIKEEMIKEGVILIDVGTSLVEGKVKGDVDFSSVEGKAKLVTGVPGGVGPLTVMALFDNLLRL